LGVIGAPPALEHVIMQTIQIFTDGVLPKMPETDHRIPLIGGFPYSSVVLKFTLPGDRQSISQYANIM